MRIPKKTIKLIAIISGIAAIIFFIFAAAFYLTSPTLDYMIIIALAIGVGPPSIVSIIHNRWKMKIEKATPEFLRDLATASRTGIPIASRHGTCIPQNVRSAYRRTQNLSCAYELGHEL